MIKVHYDPKTTLVIGYYPDSIEYSSIPEPFIAIENNAQILNKQMCVINGKYQEYIKPIEQQLKEAKDEKLAQLRINFNSASQKPYELKQVKQIDKDGNVIKKINTTFNINDTNLTASENIIFAGSFMIIQAWLKVLCQSIKVDFTAIENAVNALSDNPATSSIANIPYTSKDKNGNEIRVLLSFKVIQEIFKHIFNRVADNSKAYNIIEEQIKKASTIEELEKININI